MSGDAGEEFLCNWVIGRAKEHLSVRAEERAAGVPETELTPLGRSP